VPSLIGRCGGGGGGGLTRFNGTYTGNTVTIGGGGFGNLTVDTKVRGDAVLDLTTPSAPTVTKTGYWAFTVTFGSVLPGMTVGANFVGRFDASDSDAAGADAFCYTVSALSTAALPDPEVSFGATVWLTSGSSISLSVQNMDAVNSDFGLDTLCAAFLGGT
jgi:hypothetical protein